MISSLRGALKNISMTELTVNVGGVGYEVFIPLSTYDKLPKEGEEVSLFIHTNVKEDAIQLFGFATEIEKKIFRLLVNQVTGIGPKLALNVLSSVSPGSLCSAIADGNAKALGKISGIGKKTAERIVLELRGKLKDEAFAALSGQVSGKFPSESSKACEDAILALVQLGFKYENAAKTVHEAAKEMKDSDRTSENLIRTTLAKLNS
jgi:Holliday junction DNA helicase RuvA